MKKKPKIIVTDNRKEYYRKRKALYFHQIIRAAIKHKVIIEPYLN